MRLYKTTKKVLKISPNAEKFLNGLTANSFDRPQNAFLNIHGRIIATFDQFKINNDEFLIVLEKDLVPAVLEHLDKYARLSKSTIEEKPFNVYFNLDQDYKPGAEQYTIPQKKGELVLTERVLKAEVEEGEFRLFRLKNNIPLQGVDFRDEFLLNINETDFVSFTKGCFLGQEPVAKVHNRSKPTWVLRVKYERDCSEEEKQKMTSKTLDPAVNEMTGFVFVKNI